MRPKFHTLKVKEVRRETPQCVSVSFEVPDELRENYQFKQGQYLTLRQTIGGEDIRRSYSICSGLDEGELRVAIKEVENGAFSTWANRHLKSGDELQVMTPMGNFTSELVNTQQKNYLLIAGGSGITPVLSIAKSVLKREPKSEVTLIYGNRFFSSIIFRDQLEDMKDRYLGRFRVFHVLSDEPNEVELFSGNLDGNKVAEFSKVFIHPEDADEVFICGPEPMMRSVSGYLKERGISEDKIHFELFASPGQVQTQETVVAKPVVVDSGKKSAITIVYDGQESNFYMPMDGSRILDAAQKHGIDIPFSCKGGMCCTCRAHVSEGTAEMAVNYALEPGEVDMGYVLTCQARPTSEKVVIDFDRH